jgi:hypothetical protein
MSERKSRKRIKIMSKHKGAAKHLLTSNVPDCVLPSDNKITDEML